MQNMKKLLGSILIVTAGIIVSYCEQIPATHNLLLSNVEALAQKEATSKKYDCYSIFVGTGSSISCATCKETTGTPPWYHFGSTCER